MPDAIQKPASRTLLERLCAEFPVFREYRPLAIGVHKALMARIPELDKGQVRSALHAHTGSTRYLKAIVEGAQRHDLDGNPSGAVTAEQHALATTTLRDRFKRIAERRKAEQKQLEESRKAEQEEQLRQEKLLKLAEKFASR